MHRDDVTTETDRACCYECGTEGDDLCATYDDPDRPAIEWFWCHTHCPVCTALPVRQVDQ